MPKLNLEETAWFKDYFKISMSFIKSDSLKNHSFPKVNWFQGSLELEDGAGELAKWVKQLLASLSTLVQILRKHG